MKTKEEAIKEAWGADYNKMIRDNGWSTTEPKNKEGFDEKEEFCTDIYKNDSTRFIWRPKSLQGLEDNNGWICIKSESDLPKDFCACSVIVKGVVINVPLYYHPINKTFTDNMIVQNYSHFSHYKKIDIPKKLPIY